MMFACTRLAKRLIRVADRNMKIARVLWLVAIVALSFARSSSGRNVILFVADGLRSGSVNMKDMPTLYALRQGGVWFANSHSLFPTFTTANASAMATGHLLGDTGDFSNTFYTGFPIEKKTGIDVPSTETPFIENDVVIEEIDDHFGGNYLNEETLLAFARKNGYLTAAVGKLGPTLIQDAPEGASSNGTVPAPETVIIDDSTGRDGGIPLRPEIADALRAAGLTTTAPTRANAQPEKTKLDNGFSGNNETPGTIAANKVQQQYFASALTGAILPSFVRAGKPFVVVFWSRDPDGTQHNQGDSLNQLRPGINGPTSRKGVLNADNNLRLILEYLHSVGGLSEDTDVFVTADHGFSTISKSPLDSSGKTVTKSYSATKTYRDSKGRQEVNNGFLPPGFLAIDLAHALGLPLFDPDQAINQDGTTIYKPVDPELSSAPTNQVAQRPSKGDGVIGGTGKIPTDAKVVIAANGGSDLIYVTEKDRDLVQKIVQFLTTQDYISGIFSDPEYGEIDGALKLTDIGLKGSTQLPTPAVVVNFRSFAIDPAKPNMSAVTICDTGLQQGQGMHGSFNRADTFNCMAATGPDFKKRFVDNTPVSNADLAWTFAQILKLQIPHNGTLLGRTAVEALVNGPRSVAGVSKTLESKPAANGQKTVLRYQQVGQTVYFDAAGFPGRTVGLGK
jgi:hypothetical protein